MQLSLLLHLLVCPAHAGELGPASQVVEPARQANEEAARKESEPPPPPSLTWDSFVASAYQPWCPGCVGFTADGTRADADHNIIAVDPAVLPMGGRYLLRFPDGQCHVYTARDTGGDIKGHRIDILMHSDREAYAWGVRRIQVAPLGKAEPTRELLELNGCVDQPARS